MTLLPQNVTKNNFGYRFLSPVYVTKHIKKNSGGNLSFSLKLKIKNALLAMSLRNISLEIISCFHQNMVP